MVVRTKFSTHLTIEHIPKNIFLYICSKEYLILSLHILECIIKSFQNVIFEFWFLILKYYTNILTIFLKPWFWNYIIHYLSKITISKFTNMPLSIELILNGHIEQPLNFKTKSNSWTNKIIRMSDETMWIPHPKY